MTDLEKAMYIIDKIENDENFDLIDYYSIEKRTPTEFVKGIKSQLSPSNARILNSFAGVNYENSEWKERHYVMFFESKDVIAGKELSVEDKEKIINNLLDLGLFINDRTVKVMMKRYVRLSLEKEDSHKMILK